MLDLTYMQNCFDIVIKDEEHCTFLTESLSSVPGPCHQEFMLCRICAGQPLYDVQAMCAWTICTICAWLTSV